MRIPCSERCDGGEYGDLINQGGRIGTRISADFNCRPSIAPCDQFAVLLFELCDGMLTPRPIRMSSKRARVDSSAGIDHQLRPWKQRGRAEKNDSARKVPRTLAWMAWSFWPRQSGGVALPAQLRTKRPQGDFPVIARPQRLFHASRPLGEQAGEQDAGLHLRARHRHAMVDPVQMPPRMCSGGRSSTDARISAPISTSGFMIRAMGAGKAIHPRNSSLVKSDRQGCRSASAWSSRSCRNSTRWSRFEHRSAAFDLDDIGGGSVRSNEPQRAHATQGARAISAVE